MKRYTYAELKEIALEVIEDNCLDIQDEVSNDYLATCAANILFYLQNGYKVVDNNLTDTLQVKANNCYKGYISVSDDEATGVSHTEYKLYDGYDLLDAHESIETILDMINEAWYLLRND